MLPPYCRGTDLPGEGCCSVARSLWRTELGAGDGSGGGEEAGGRPGWGLRHGKDVMGEGTACTCPDAGVEEEGDSG